MAGAEFVYEASREDAYLVRPSMAYGGKGELVPCKNKLMKTLVSKGRTNIIIPKSRFLYHAGTYTFDSNPVPMTTGDFVMLSEEVRLLPIHGKLMGLLMTLTCRLSCVSLQQRRVGGRRPSRASCRTTGVGFSPLSDTKPVVWGLTRP